MHARFAILDSRPKVKRLPNKPDAVNPAIASRFHFGYHWRGVTDPGRWADMTKRGSEAYGRQTTTSADD